MNWDGWIKRLVDIWVKVRAEHSRQVSWQELLQHEDAQGCPDCPDFVREVRGTTAVLAQGYRLLELRGRGGFGVVWAALDPQNYRRAVKLICWPPGHPERQREESFLEIIRRGDLSHPALCRIITDCSLPDVLIIVSELAEHSLGRRANDRGLSLEELIGYILEVAEVLDYLHAAGWVHRDVKPENILLEKGRVRLADFGLMKLWEQDTSNSVVGTPHYMAPEAALGCACPASDQFSLARTYVELRLGRQQLLRTGCTADIDLRNLPQAERRVLLRALAPDSGQRYPTCIDFARVLEKVLGTRGELVGMPGGADIQTDESRPARLEHINVGRVPFLSEGRQFVGRDDEIQMLNAAWSAGQPAVVVFIAAGGVGKSAIVRHWLNQLQERRYTGVVQALDWSFPNQGQKSDERQGTDSTQFRSEALRHFARFGLEVQDTERENPRWIGERIGQKFLDVGGVMVLDGVEPLQYSPRCRNGQLRDEGLEGLVRVVSKAPVPSQGEPRRLLIITSWYPVVELADKEAMGLVKTVPLENLSEDVGAQLLKSFRFIDSPGRGLYFSPAASVVNQEKATQEEFKTAAREYGRHALALVLLASYLLRRHAGDLSRRPPAPANLLTEEYDDEPHRHARRILSHFTEIFQPDAAQSMDRVCWQVVSMLGLFDRPTRPDLLQVVWKWKGEPIYPLTDGLTEEQLWAALHELRNIRLVTGGHVASQPVDMHPLVRAHFGTELRHRHPTAWRQAHSRLYEHFSGTSMVPKEQPDSLEEMGPLFLAVAHGCEANRYMEALGTVWHRINRGHQWYSTLQLNAYDANLTAVSHFFEGSETSWGRPVPTFTGVIRGGLLGLTGTLLGAVGRLDDAREALESSFAILARRRYSLYEMVLSLLPPSMRHFLLPRVIRSLGRGQFPLQGVRATIARHLCAMYMLLGDLDKAVNIAERDVESSDQVKTALDPTGDIHRVLSRATLGHVWHLRGDLGRAETWFREAERLLPQIEPRAKCLHSIYGTWYCEMLLDRGEYGEAERRAHEMSKMAAGSLKGQLGTADQFLPLIVLGRARVSLATPLTLADSSRTAVEELDRAVAGIRMTAVPWWLAWPLLARASVRRQQGELSLAKNDVDEAQRIAGRHGMRLYEADCHLESALLSLDSYRMSLDVGLLRTARMHLDSTKEMIANTGYGGLKVKGQILEDDLNELQGAPSHPG